MRNFNSNLSALTCSLITILFSVCAQAQTFQADFNGPLDFDGKWTYVAPSSVGAGSNGNNSGTVSNSTQFSNAPFIASDGTNSFVRLRLDTFNSYSDPTQPGKRFFKGTEMYSRVGFGNAGGSPSQNVLRVEPSNTGFEFETRMRYTNPQVSGVGAFWTYWNHGTSGDY